MKNGPRDVPPIRNSTIVSPTAEHRRYLLFFFVFVGLFHCFCLFLFDKDTLESFSFIFRLVLSLLIVVFRSFQYTLFSKRPRIER